MGEARSTCWAWQIRIVVRAASVNAIDRKVLTGMRSGGR
jgi:hypothetical protein